MYLVKERSLDKVKRSSYYSGAVELRVNWTRSIENVNVPPAIKAAILVLARYSGNEAARVTALEIIIRNAREFYESALRETGEVRAEIGDPSFKGWMVTTGDKER